MCSSYSDSVNSKTKYSMVFGLFLRLLCSTFDKNICSIRLQLHNSAMWK